MSSKEIQGKWWSTTSQHWAQHFEPWFLPMYKEGLDCLELNKRHLLLDAGCGSGLFSNLAIGAGAQVISIDASPGLLEIARQRSPYNNFIEGDLESLPFASNSFHVVTGLNSFQYAGDFNNTLSEANRVLKAYGRLVIGIWDKPDLCDAGLVFKSIETLLPRQTAESCSPFSLSHNNNLESICENMGFWLIHSAVVPCHFLYSSLNDAVKGFMGTSTAAAAVDLTDQFTVENTIFSALKPFHITDGIHFLKNSVRIYVFEK
jgi:SAM-dependent methyltransferase